MFVTKVCIGGESGCARYKSTRPKDLMAEWNGRASRIEELVCVSFTSSGYEIELKSPERMMCWEVVMASVSQLRWEVVEGVLRLCGK